ncbi:MAG: hypothetical protein ACR2G6_15620 [Gemmatimonadaceae bacterium]
MAGGLGVAEPEIPPERAALVVGQVKQLGKRERLDVGRAQDMLDAKFPAREIALESEVREVMNDAGSLDADWHDRHEELPADVQT